MLTTAHLLFHAPLREAGGGIVSARPNAINISGREVSRYCYAARLVLDMTAIGGGTGWDNEHDFAPVVRGMQACFWCRRCLLELSESDAEKFHKAVYAEWLPTPIVRESR